MMKGFKQSWKIGSINFHLVEGDIFDVSVDAIVNSELFLRSNKIFKKLKVKNV